MSQMKVLVVGLNIVAVRKSRAAPKYRQSKIK